jgi:hypothetical protein
MMVGRTPQRVPYRRLGAAVVASKAMAAMYYQGSVVLLLASVAALLAAWRLKTNPPRPRVNLGLVFVGSLLALAAAVAWVAA